MRMGSSTINTTNVGAATRGRLSFAMSISIRGTQSRRTPRTEVAWRVPAKPDVGTADNHAKLVSYYVQQQSRGSIVEQDKFALRASQAGMRFIAQMHIFNSGDDDRLRTFIADSYHADALASNDQQARFEFLSQWRDQVGRVRVQQVMATSEHAVIVILNTEQSDEYYYTELHVEADYPHRIVGFKLVPMVPVEHDDAVVLQPATMVGHNSGISSTSGDGSTAGDGSTSHGQPVSRNDTLEHDMTESTLSHD